MQIVVSMRFDKANPETSTKESVTCCVGLIDGTVRVIVPLPGQGCGEGGD